MSLEKSSSFEKSPLPITLSINSSSDNSTTTQSQTCTETGSSQKIEKLSNRSITPLARRSLSVFKNIEYSEFNPKVGKVDELLSNLEIIHYKKLSERMEAEIILEVSKGNSKHLDNSSFSDITETASQSETETISDTISDTSMAQTQPQTATEMSTLSDTFSQTNVTDQTSTSLIDDNNDVASLDSLEKFSFSSCSLATCETIDSDVKIPRNTNHKTKQRKILTGKSDPSIKLSKLPGDKFFTLIQASLSSSSDTSTIQYGSANFQLKKPIELETAKVSYTDKLLKKVVEKNFVFVIDYSSANGKVLIFENKNSTIKPLQIIDKEFINSQNSTCSYAKNDFDNSFQPRTLTIVDQKYLIIADQKSSLLIVLARTIQKRKVRIKIRSNSSSSSKATKTKKVKKIYFKYLYKFGIRGFHANDHFQSIIDVQACQVQESSISSSNELAKNCIFLLDNNSLNVIKIVDFKAATVRQTIRLASFTINVDIRYFSVFLDQENEIKILTINKTKLCNQANNFKDVGIISMHDRDRYHDRDSFDDTLASSAVENDARKNLKICGNYMINKRWFRVE